MLPCIVHSVLSFSLFDSIMISIKYKFGCRMDDHDQMMLLDKKNVKD